AAGLSDASALEKVARELPVAYHQCTTLLALGEYQLLSLDAPNVPPDELKTAVRWRLKDMLDYHVDDATVDVLNVPVDKNAPVRTRLMFAVAARNQLIERRQAAFAESKVKLDVIDIPEMAQRNVAAFLEPEGRGVAMLSFDTDGGLLTISYAGELYLSRRIDVTLHQLAESDPEQKTSYHERIALELQRSLDHFDRQYHFITVAKLVLSPIGDAAGELQQHLASNLYLPVETLNLASVLNLSKVSALLTPEAQQRYFMTLGAALRHEEKTL
ncbi:MAG TPA: agglutinin biogenesis protein MshI, partial [Noviherbaspirillum sp.]|uniref:type IV pilus biogenesis protein PilM n=1 Tax=Noviherbaspirillum sp. TaxID=1926288 RepID=UPI002DDC940D